MLPGKWHLYSTWLLVTMRFLNGRKLIDGRSDDAQTLAKLSLVDDQGRGEADYISVSWLGLRENC